MSGSVICPQNAVMHQLEGYSYCVDSSMSPMFNIVMTCPGAQGALEGLLSTADSIRNLLGESFEKLFYFSERHRTSQSGKFKGKVPKSYYDAQFQAVLEKTFEKGSPFITQKMINPMIYFNKLPAESRHFGVPLILFTQIRVHQKNYSTPL